MKKILYPIVHSFLVCISFSKAMDQQHSLPTALATKAALAKFQGKISVWDNEKTVPSKAKLSLFIPNSLIITPDEKGVVLASPGLVSYVNFKAKLSKPFTLIEHTHKEYCPMLAVAMQGNELLVVSVINPKEEGQKAHCIVSHNEINSRRSNNHELKDIFGNRYYQEIECEPGVPVQAITLSPEGKILAIAFPDAIKIFDLTECSNSNCKKFFMPRIKNEDSVKDISEAVPVSSFSDDRHIATVNNRGVIDVKRVSVNNGLSVETIKDVKTEELIEKIHLSVTQELLFVTTNGEVKLITHDDWLEYIQGKVKNRVISFQHENGKAAVDQGLNYLNYDTIHWIDNPDLPEDVRLKIYVHRENNASVEDFTISMPNDLPKTYNCITEKGQRALRPMHILIAALRGNSVVAALADGNLYFWRLPAKYQQPTDSMVARGRPIIIPRSNPSSPGISRRTRNRSSTDGGEQKPEDIKNGINSSPVSPSTPRRDWTHGKKRSSDPTKGAKKDKPPAYMDTLGEDALNDFHRTKEKKDKD